MKTLFFCSTFALVLGVASLTATEPEPASGGGCCPMCKMGGEDKGAVRTEIAFKEASATPQDDTEKTVLELEAKWCDAEAAHDVAFIEKVETDGFVFTDSTGKITTKQDEIAEAKQGGEAIKFRLSDMKAHVYGNAAVLTGLTTFLGVEAGGAAPVAYRWTDVFVKQANGEWQVAASQATAVGESKVGEEKSGE